eukprot:TRINITY_DN2565_c0_g1_i2.p1 TRINITY_DN2565_c0_g1~~TRINITY_DN2565_c0_g1_i2.p1  ORF type:complete len:925 (+),score=190.92 TRINITY_DN2565_c0_g1_i2:290-3064(+)
MEEPALTPVNESAVAFEVVASSNPSLADVPLRVRRRLLENSESKSCAASLEKIEAKLEEAHVRRQQFHQWLANKAKPKPRSPCGNDARDLLERLEAKLSAAERKRLELLSQEKMRLARSDELRQAAKTELQMRAEKEREELESKFETKVQQAEEKRMCLLQAEKTRAHLRVMQARTVANSVSLKREMEMKKLKEKLENRLQKAKRKRAELLKQRGRRGSASHSHSCHKMHRHGDRLSRQLARVWRQFQSSHKTTHVLAQDYAARGINHDIVSSLPFEQLASRIQSTTTLEALKALLARIESRFILSQASQSTVTQIDHLLKRLSPAKKKTPAGNRAAKGGASQLPVKGTIRGPKSEDKNSPRYPARVFLCAYMILGHPDAVFSGRGEREISLTEAAGKLVTEFESLLRLILAGRASGSPQSSPSSLKSMTNYWNSNASQVPQRTFASQLAAFDAAWCSYLYRFVVWKVKDARSLEDDLIRMACQLEVSMLQKCKIPSEGEGQGMSHDAMAIRREVLEDQRILREKVRGLCGAEGVARMETALAEARATFMDSKESGVHIFAPIYSQSPESSGSSYKAHKSVENSSKKVVRALFKDSEAKLSNDVSTSNDRIGFSDNKLSNENVIMVNSILHDRDRSFADNVCGLKIQTENTEGKMAQEIKVTMETAFWSSVEESLKQDRPDYTWVVNLVKEVRDELLQLVPLSWKEELLESIDIELFSQMLESGSQDLVYLRKLFNYTLSIVVKLGTPADENKLKSDHEILLSELSGTMSDACVDAQFSFAYALVKGLRYILEHVQDLKKEISAARIRLLEPLVQGSAGIKYLQQAFTMCYSLPSEAGNSLPRTLQWLAAVKQSLHIHKEEFELSASLSASENHDAQSTGTSSVPSVKSLRTGLQLITTNNVPSGEGGGSVSSAGLVSVCPICY